MSVDILQGDVLEVLRGMAGNSIDLIATDPPYYRVKSEWWDRQWDTTDGFLAWMGQLCEEWWRVLKPNGSLYVFASPKMSARVECKIAERFNVLNRIRWVKDAGWHNKAEKEGLRSFLSPWEEIIFAEHYGADNIAKGEVGYAAKCDELRGFLFEPLRAYLDGERQRADVSFEQVRQIVGCADGSGLPSHWFTQSQWMLPTEANYLKLREGFNRQNHSDYLRREYEDLRREYEDLRREYEDLRRPFSVSADVPYTDVWDFATVQAYPGKHPCEKPLAMMEHIVRTSSKPGALVADFFMGSGTTAVACQNLGRRFIGCDLSQHWVDYALERLEQPTQMKMPIEKPGQGGGRLWV